MVREEAGHDWLGELAAAVADGRVLDWESLESSARDEEERSAIWRLRAIAAIGQAHSNLTFSDSASESESVRSLLQGVEDSSTPASWGSLRIHERVGRGRFGDVYRAWDPTLAREVALKLQRRRDVDATEVDREVIEEGRLMARVRHPNVVTIHGAQRIDGRTGLWMEFVRGRTLEAELRDRGPFASEEVARIGIELCRALAAVHDAGLVHRDVKAQNVLRESNGRIVLGDFGTGYHCDDEDRPTALAGTPAYLAPEIFQGAVADVRSDIYALGVMLFRLASGTYPVHGRSLQDLRAAHAQHERVALETVRPEIPRSLRVTIERAINVSPAERYQSAAAMEAGLSDALSQFGEPQRTSLLRPVGIASLVVLIATVSVVAFLNGRGPERKTNGHAEAVANRPPEESNTAGPTVSTSTETLPPPTGPSDIPANEPEVASDRFPESLPIGKTLPPRVLRQVAGRDFPSTGPPSPDGRLVAFTDPDGALALFEVASGKRWRITEAQSPMRPVPARFSLDGSRILYLRAAGPIGAPGSTRPEIRSQPVAGGESTLIWQAPDAGPLLLFNSAGGDETVLAGRRATGGVELLLISTTSGQIVASRVVQPLVSGATLSADRRFVAYDFVDPVSGVRDIDLWNVTLNSTSSLIRDQSSDRQPLWTHDGRHLLFTSTRSGSVDLWAQRVEDGKAVGVPTRLESIVGYAGHSGLTRDGTLFIARIGGAQETYLADLDRTLIASTELRRLSKSVTSPMSSATWSPNGQQLAFVQRLDDRWSIVIRSLADGQEKELHHGVYPISQLQWERGGDSLLFLGFINRMNGLHRLDVASGKVTTVLDARQQPSQMFAVRPLPDQGVVLVRLAPGSDSQIGRVSFELIRKDLATGAETVLQRGRLGLTQIEVSHRGDQIAYFLDGSIRVVDLGQPDHARDVLVMPASPSLSVNALAWSANDRELIISRSATTLGPPTSAASMQGGDGRLQVMTLWAVDVSTGDLRVLSEPLGSIAGVAISPDGRQLAFSAGFEYSELWALENATASLTP